MCWIGWLTEPLSMAIPDPTVEETSSGKLAPTRRTSICTRSSTQQRGTMSSEASSFERTDDIENRMRRRLGLDAGSVPGSVPSHPIDPLRGARQAIRSQAVAREYVERQLAHAEAPI